MTDTLQEQPAVEELTAQDQLQQLISERTGQFEINMDYADLKWVRNSLEKAEFKGSNEAYLVVTSILSIDQILKSMDPKSTESHTITLDATVIETINFFLNRHSGKGLESARRLFIAAMKFRTTMEKISNLDKSIEKLNAEIKSDKK